MKYVFVGHFSSVFCNDNVASSAAGNQVQREILMNMQEYTNGNTLCYSMNPMPFWPRGPLVAKSHFENDIEFIGYVNLPILKHIFFSVKLLFRLIKIRPRLCIQYNSYFFENLILLIFKLFFPLVSLVIVIQDIHVVKRLFSLSRRSLRSISERLSLCLSRRFDTIVPISTAIISDFKFDPARCFVFQGGGTEFTKQLILSEHQKVTEIGVFAGSLESYNGVDKLVDYWVSNKIEYSLHIFGRGTLSSYIERNACTSKNIIYHGQQSEEIIRSWQRKAMWNFCLRYSIGLNQEYFFPSKFFNIACAPGIVIANDFYGLPVAFYQYISIVQDDLSDLSMVLMDSKFKLSFDAADKRKDIVSSSHNWRACIKKIFEMNNIDGI
jgi:hypothetical protein